MQLIPNLLFNNAPDGYGSSIFRATYNAHGLYNTQQFVLRLSPVIHRTLAGHTSGITTNGDLGFEGAQAMSTLLHETVHWWQHIGSTYGFILSLNTPVQAHCTHSDLKALVKADGFKKSVLKRSAQLGREGPSGFGTVSGRANTIVNNHFDLLAFRAFTLGPGIGRAIAQHSLFESVGHAFSMTYAHTISTLAATVDRNFNVLPDPRKWEAGFDRLRKQKVQGYYFGSSIGLYPMGSREIFEGQARFAQMQYLSFACGHRLNFDSFRSLGMLNGVYIKAFEEFLRITKSVWPKRIDDPLVGLFLLVCDLAINPGSGFPAPVMPTYETFIDDVNPAARFYLFCQLITERYPAMKVAIREYSRSEYEAVSTVLCESAVEIPPLKIAGLFAKWFSRSGALTNLRAEYDAYDFKPENFVIRHLLAHFLAFQEDKAKRPEFFCWPGAWAAGDNVDREAVSLFEKHQALFIDKEDDDSIFPRIQEGRAESTLQEAFNTFYQHAVVFNLTNQWIADAGPFNYDLSWLSASASEEEMQQFLQNQFYSAFELDLRDAQILGA